MSRINLDLLPSELRDLVRALGEATAFKLVEHRGGGRVIVPKKVNRDHPLMDLLGFRGFADLVEHYANIVLELPKYDGVTRQLRHQLVRKLRGEGMTHDRIAVATGYTRRHVINILGDDSDLVPADQLDLFGHAVESAPELPAVSANDPFRLARPAR